MPAHGHAGPRPCRGLFHAQHVNCGCCSRILWVPIHATNIIDPNPAHEIAHGATVGIWGAGLADMVPTAMPVPRPCMPTAMPAHGHPCPRPCRGLFHAQHVNCGCCSHIVRVPIVATDIINPNPGYEIAHSATVGIWGAGASGYGVTPACGHAGPRPCRGLFHAQHVNCGCCSHIVLVPIVATDIINPNPGYEIAHSATVGTWGAGTSGYGVTPACGHAGPRPCRGLFHAQHVNCGYCNHIMRVPIHSTSINNNPKSGYEIAHGATVGTWVRG
jgi:hypothetical protein